MIRLVNAYHVWIGYSLTDARFNKLSWLTWSFYFFFVCVFRVFEQFWLAGAFGILYFVFSLLVLRNSFQKKGSLASGLAISREEKVKNGFLAGLGAVAILVIFLFLTLLVMSIPSARAFDVVFQSEQYRFDASFYLAALLWCVTIYLLAFPASVTRSKGIGILFMMGSIGVGAGGAAFFPTMVNKIVEQVSDELLPDGSYQMAELYVYELPGGWFTTAALAAATIIIAAIVLKVSCKFYKTGR
ncbi:MAG: hypothetical protein IKU83_01785 [Lachnospiraceae bacterium]|nr:hypothetical protein [Lachnospiraceae bacterium]